MMYYYSLVGLYQFSVNHFEHESIIDFFWYIAILPRLVAMRTRLHLVVCGACMIGETVAHYLTSKRRSRLRRFS